MADAKKTSNAVPAAPKEGPQQVNPTAVTTELKQPLRAKPNLFRRSEVVEVRYTHMAEPAATLADIMQPDYWTHVSDVILPMAHITVINKAHGWEAQLRVLQVANKLVKVAKLTENHWEAVTGSEDVSRLKGRYRVEHRADGWRVIDTDGNQLIAGLGSENEGHKFIDQLVNNIAA